MASLILAACYGFIAWLLRRDLAWRNLGSGVLLIPWAWIAIQGSRPLSYWISLGDAESHPINTVVFCLFLTLSAIALSKRGFSIGAFATRNKAIFCAYLYLLSTVFWSELPLESFKRIVKDFGAVLVGLVLLSIGATPAVMRGLYVRVAYVLFPLSVVFIKYFPAIGRQSTRAGDNMFTGVTTQKNSLGLMVFVCSLMILWDALEIRRSPRKAVNRQQLWIRVGLLVTGLWLLVVCDSQTSLLCLIVGCALFWLSGRLVRMHQGKHILMGLLLGSGILAALNSVFGIKEAILALMGRDPSLTGRTDIWRVVLEQNTDPWFGTGFCIFWDTEKGANAIDALMRINSAHNGYLEMYLDGGWIGVILLGILLFTSGRFVISRLFSGHPLGRMGFVFWVLVIIYNFSESSFFRLDILWFTFLALILESPIRAQKSTPHVVSERRLEAAVST